MMQTVIDAGFAASILSRYAGALPAPVLWTVDGGRVRPGRM